MEIDETAIRALFNQAMKLADPWEAEVILSGGSCTVLRFANNRFHQNVRENRLQLYVRVVRGKRMGVAMLDRFSEGQLAAAVARAKEVAELGDEHEDLLPLPAPQAYPVSPGRYDASFSRLDLKGLGERLGEYIARGEEAGFEIAGKMEMVEGTIGDYGELLPLAMANSRGLFVHSPATWFDFSTSVFTDESSGWGGNGARRFDLMDWERAAQAAIEKARAGRRPQALEPGRYTVILEPAALRALIGYLSGSFNAQAVLEDRSFLGGKLGQKIFPQWFSLSDDAYHPSLGGASFDGEGMPVKRVPLVESGVLRSYVNTRALAARMGTEPTGHGFSIPNPIGALPLNLVMSGGQSDLAGLIAETKKAILVTRIWYTTPVDEKQLILSGMTRDGTFLVENGKIVAALRNLRFNQSLPDMIRSVEAAGKPVACQGAMLPPLRVAEFNFTSATRF